MQIQNLYFFDKFGKNLNLDWDTDESYWKGIIYFPEISTYLYDNENIFILEKDLNDYKFPMLQAGDALIFEWKDNAIENELFLYEVEKDYDLDNFFIDKKSEVKISYDDLIPTSGGPIVDIKLPLQVNIAFNPSEEVKYERTLCVFIENGTEKTKVAEIGFYGEGLDEDERFGVWARNFGIKFNKEDANILKDYDIKEAFPDWKQLNQARKSLLVNKEQVYPYIGTYKGLSNFINLLGYKDVLQIKEYWTNINKKSSYYKKQFLVDITDFLDDGVIDNINILDKNKNIKFGKQFKKTECLALVYQFTRATDVFDDDGIPEVEETTDFTVNEIFYKLNQLNKKVKQEFLPVNVRIKDIIGEFIYFQKITIKFWKDDSHIFDFDLNEESEVQSFPDKNVDLTIRSLNPLLKRRHAGGYPFGSVVLNPGVSNPYENAQKYPGPHVPIMVDFIKEYYEEIKNQRYPDLGKRLEWEDGDDFERVIGAPCVFNIFNDKFTFTNFKGVTFDDLKSIGAYDPYYTLENINFRNFYEITWRITKDAPNPYSFVYRGKITDFYQLPHILPYHGKYRVTAELHDFYGNTNVYSKFVTVQDDQIPQIVAMTRLEDKFKYTIENLKNVRLIDFGTSPSYYPKVNILDNESSMVQIDMDKNLMEFDKFYNAQYNIYDVEFYNITSNTYVKYDNTPDSYSKKSYWGLGNGDKPIRLQDFKGMTMDSLFFMRLSDLIYVGDFKAGFYIKNPAPGKQIQISLFSEYTIPQYTTLDELVGILNSSTHPGIRLFNYEIINGRKKDGQYIIHAQAEYLSKEMYHILMSEGMGSPGSPAGSESPVISSSPSSGLPDVDKYTFFLPNKIYSDRLINYFKSISPVFDDETMFLFAKTSDILNGAVQDPGFWVDNEYWKFVNNKQIGYLPTVIDQNSFNINDVKVFETSFNIPKNTPVFFNVNNINGKLEYIWKLIDSKSGEEVVRTRSVPFFIWKFKDTGTYTVQVEIHDNRGNIYTNEVAKMVNVLEKNQYIKNVEARLERRKHKLLN